MISLNDFTYDLPDDKIAQYPLLERDKSKLLVYNKGQIFEGIFYDIDQYLPSHSLLCFNNTKVIKARLLFQKSTGAVIEIFCLEPIAPADYQLAFQKQGSIEWACLVGNLKKWRNETLTMTLQIDTQQVILQATLIEKHSNWQKVLFSWMPENLSFGCIIDAVGKIPLPPYIKREAEAVDAERYQTIFSLYEGSVAAPTAGLHFTSRVIDKLLSKNIEQLPITLHVGAGTFKPIKDQNIMQHQMHVEYFNISYQAIEKLLSFQGNITAVGTTTMRALESLYWLGIKMIKNPKLKDYFIGQWDYQNLPFIPTSEVLAFLHNYCKTKGIETIRASTGLMIIPGYNFAIVNRLITNFHQPQSTLLLLVAAFVGEKNWRTIYNYALQQNFRFLSYGDSSLLIP